MQGGKVVTELHLCCRSGNTVEIKQEGGKIHRERKHLGGGAGDGVRMLSREDAVKQSIQGGVNIWSVGWRTVGARALVQ
jgi:hypothetical protein